MSDPVRRAIRTWIQSFVGGFLSTGALSAVQVSGVVDWSILLKAVVSAIAASIISLLTLVMNLVEDHTRMPALLKPEVYPRG